jgi:hypothetical protein
MSLKTLKKTTRNNMEQRTFTLTERQYAVLVGALEMVIQDTSEDAVVEAVDDVLTTLEEQAGG